MQPLSKIVVVGGGTSGWLAAAMLRHHLKRELCEIELVESEDIGAIGVGESTVPPFVGLIQRLGIDEKDFIRATNATYKLGIQFVGWHRRTDTYFHPFGVIGKPIGTQDFYQCWLKATGPGRRFLAAGFLSMQRHGGKRPFLSTRERAQYADWRRELCPARRCERGRAVLTALQRRSRRETHRRPGHPGASS